LDRYDVGHEITGLLAISDQPLEDIKYFVKILGQSYKIYSDRESIKVNNDLRQIELGMVKV